MVFHLDAVLAKILQMLLILLTYFQLQVIFIRQDEF